MTRCSACPQNTRCLPGDGPTPANIMCIGTRTGWGDDNGRLFYGQAGQEWNDNYLQLAGLSRDDVFFTNTVKCLGDAPKPSDADIAACSAHWLPAQVAEVQPEVIVLMGGVATSLVPAITSVELEHGYPRRVQNVAAFGGWSGTVLSMYHPEAGAHETAKMIPLLEDWENFGKWLKGKWQPPTPPGSKPRYSWLESRSDFKQVRLGSYSYSHLPIDTESDESRPYSIQFSPNPQIAYMFRIERTDVLDEFRAWFYGEFDARACCHNILYDENELEKSRVELRGRRDTMQEAYQLGNLPQGLKALAFRLLGLRMISYDDVVTPYSKRKLDEWLAEAYEIVFDMWGTHAELKTGGYSKVRKAHAAEAVLKRVMKAINTDGSDYDPWQLPKVNAEGEKQRLIGRPWLPELEDVLGRMPRPSIVHAPQDKQLEYGCSDAYVTGLAATALARRRKEIMQHEWAVDESDYDRRAA